MLMKGGSVMEMHVITNGRLADAVLMARLAVLAPYVDYIHLREKQKTARELHQLCEDLQKAGVPMSKLIVNDRVDVAASCGAAGVQLAWHSLPVSAVKRAFPNLRAGCSVHSVEEAVQAEQSGANYVVYGHIYGTDSKPGVPPRGPDALARVTTAVDIPVIAIGGIHPIHLDELNASGAAGFAVMSAVMDVPDAIQAVKAYVDRRKT